MHLHIQISFTQPSGSSNFASACLLSSSLWPFASAFPFMCGTRLLRYTFVQESLTRLVFQVTDVVQGNIFTLNTLTNISTLSDLFMGVTAYNVATSTTNDPSPKLTVFFGLVAMIVVCGFLIYRGLYDEKRTLLLAVARNASAPRVKCLKLASLRFRCESSRSQCAPSSSRISFQTTET